MQKITPVGKNCVMKLLYVDGVEIEFHAILMSAVVLCKWLVLRVG
jgi:hypothetical protein